MQGIKSHFPISTDYLGDPEDGEKVLAFNRLAVACLLQSHLDTAFRDRKR
jgi:hypothetical protein